MDNLPKNANYDRVYAAIEMLFNTTSIDICKCPKCTNDIAAYALNCLPPHYYTDRSTDNGIHQELGSPWVMIQLAVTEAVEKVKEKPRHPRS